MADLDIAAERVLFEAEANAARFFPAEINFTLGKSPSGRDEYVNSHLQSRWEGWLAARAAPTLPKVEAAPVAWAVVSKKGGIHKLAITRESAERKAARWQVEWPDNGCVVRPLVFSDAARLQARQDGGV